MTLLERINRVINSPILIATLQKHDLEIIDLQAEFPNHSSLDSLPEPYKSSILAAEEDLHTTKIINLEDPMVSYTHESDPKSNIRVRQFKKDPLPNWATDVKPEANTP